MPVVRQRLTAAMASHDFNESPDNYGPDTTAHAPTASRRDQGRLRRILSDTPAGRRRNRAHTGTSQPPHPRTSASRGGTPRTTRPSRVLDPQATGATRVQHATRLGRAAPTRTTTHTCVPAQRSARFLPGATTRIARAVPLPMTPDLPATREVPDVVNRTWRRHTALVGATPPTRPAVRATSLSP